VRLGRHPRLPRPTARALSAHCTTCPPAQVADCVGAHLAERLRTAQTP